MFWNSVLHQFGRVNYSLFGLHKKESRRGILSRLRWRYNPFRKKEEKVVLKILSYKSASIISLGGGAFLNNKLQKEILKKTISIWLKPDFKTIYDRCKKSNHRPLIATDNNLKFNLKKLIKERYSVYSKANLTITLNKPPSAIGDNIIKRLNKIINL